MTYIEVPGGPAGWICQRCGASHGPTAASCWCQPGQMFVGTGTSFVMAPPSAAAMHEIQRTLNQILAAMEQSKTVSDGVHAEFARVCQALADAQADLRDARQQVLRERDDRRAAEVQCAIKTKEARVLSRNLSPLLRAADACAKAVDADDVAQAKRLVLAVAEAFLGYVKGMEEKP